MNKIVVFGHMRLNKLNGRAAQLSGGITKFYLAKRYAIIETAVGKQYIFHDFQIDSTKTNFDSLVLEVHGFSHNDSKVAYDSYSGTITLMTAHDKFFS